MTAGVAPVRWGYLGAGNIARKALVPAAAAVDTAELVAIAARSIERAQSLVPDGRAYGDYQALIDDPEVEAVYISLTNEVHRHWSVRAIEAGKHVLCEKPLAMDTAEVRTMVDAARAADRLLVEAVWNRWHPRTQRTIELLRSGRFGRPTAIEAAFVFKGVAPDNFRWDPALGGGALYDLGPYSLAAALWVTDWAPIDSVTATARWADSGADASLTAHLELGGATADVRASIDDDDEQYLRIRTDVGELSLSAPVFTNRDAPSSLTARRDDGSDDLVEEFEPVDPYEVMLDHVSRAIRGDETAWVLPLEESILMADAIERVRAAALAARTP